MVVGTEKTDGNKMTGGHETITRSTSKSMASAAVTALEAPSDQSLRVPCYCEENVWRLAYRKLHEGHPSNAHHNHDHHKKISSRQYHVVFVSNPHKCVPMFQQLAAKDSKTPCFWDYHVILFCTSSETSGGGGASDEETPSDQEKVQTTVVFDVDSYLPYPCPLKDYLKESFHPEQNFPKEYAPMFRLVTADMFIKNFSSDRSHMFDPISKQWSATPPQYPCILASESNSISNLDSYLNMQDTTKINRSRSSATDDPTGVDDCFGTVYTLPKLESHFLPS